jgi:hypothetical protein
MGEVIKIMIEGFKKKELKRGKLLKQIFVTLCCRMPDSGFR